MKFPEALTFDDVLLVPGFSSIKTRREVDCATSFTRQIDLKAPFISANMDTVTEAPMAIAMAEFGGIGVIHRFLPIEVEVGEGAFGFIRKGELSRDRSEQRPDRFAVGEKVDAKVTGIDKKTRKVTLSIKQKEIQEEKQAMADYGSSDSGASLGDILGAAISKAAQARGTKDDGADDNAEDEEVKAEDEEAKAPAKKAKATKKKATKATKATKAAKKSDKESAEPEASEAEADAGETAGETANDEAEAKAE